MARDGRTGGGTNYTSPYSHFDPPGTTSEWIEDDDAEEQGAAGEDDDDPEAWLANLDEADRERIEALAKARVNKAKSALGSKSAKELQELRSQVEAMQAQMRGAGGQQQQQQDEKDPLEDLDIPDPSYDREGFIGAMGKLLGSALGPVLNEIKDLKGTVKQTSTRAQANAVLDRAAEVLPQWRLGALVESEGWERAMQTAIESPSNPYSIEDLMADPAKLATIGGVANVILQTWNENGEGVVRDTARRRRGPAPQDFQEHAGRAGARVAGGARGGGRGDEGGGYDATTLQIAKRLGKSPEQVAAIRGDATGNAYRETTKSRRLGSRGAGRVV